MVVTSQIQVEIQEVLAVDINNFVLDFHNLIIEVFHKEAIFIFSTFCLMFFALAGIFAVWAFANGEFTDMERSKYEMMEEGI